jgi:hypothetical protein
MGFSCWRTLFAGREVIYVLVTLGRLNAGMILEVLRWIA